MVFKSLVDAVRESSRRENHVVVSVERRILRARATLKKPC